MSNSEAEREMVGKMKLLLRACPSARSFCDWLVSRQNDCVVTKVGVAVKHTGEEYSQVVALFKIMAELGFGEFKKGRSNGSGEGQKSRMSWSLPIRSIAVAAIGV